jgi:hypothetical protein
MIFILAAIAWTLDKLYGEEASVAKYIKRWKEVKMDEATMELEVAQFVAEVELWDSYSRGIAPMKTVDVWYELTVAGFDVNQLLENIHRHVSIMRDPETQIDLYSVHLNMLGIVVDEIERRRQMLPEDED